MSFSGRLREAAHNQYGSEFYFLDVFGKPGGDDPWGVKLDGHHLALNVAVIDHNISMTPLHLGADPAVIPSGRHAGLGGSPGETTKGFELRNALVPEQAKQAVLSDNVPADIFTLPAAIVSSRHPPVFRDCKVSSGIFWKRLSMSIWAMCGRTLRATIAPPSRREDSKTSISPGWGRPSPAKRFTTAFMARRCSSNTTMWSLPKGAPRTIRTTFILCFVRRATISETTGCGATGWNTIRDSATDKSGQIRFLRIEIQVLPKQLTAMKAARRHRFIMSN